MAPSDFLSTRLRPVLLAAALCFAGIGAAVAQAPAHGPTPPEIGTPAEKAAEPELQQHERVSGESLGKAPGRHEGEHEGGMPQLDTRTFPTQIFWLVIAFATLFYLMRRKALPRVSEILEARQERIAGDLDRAARLREEAGAAQRRQEEVVAQAHARAAEQLKVVQDRVQADMAQRQAALDADLSQRLAEAEQRIAAARDQALAELQNVAVEVAQAAVERLSGLKVNEAETRAALDRVMAEAA